MSNNSSITWRKSTRSQSNTGQCVEVGSWRKSSRSDNSTGQCVEVAACTCHDIAIRDSKHPKGGTLKLTNAEWKSFIDATRR